MKIHTWVALSVMMGFLLSVVFMPAKPLRAMNEHAVELDQGNDQSERASGKSDKGVGKIPKKGRKVDVEGCGTPEPKMLESVNEKAADNVEHSGTNGSGKAGQPDKKGLKTGKELRPKKSDGDKALKKDRPPDRRWIIKQRDQDKTKSQKKEPTPIKWGNIKQKARCESYLAQLKESFLKARYYSIQGDHCATAEYAKMFLGLVNTCTRDCPQGLVEKYGYDDRIIRNLNVLYKLGTEQCLK